MVFVVHYRIRQMYDVHLLMRIEVVQEHCISCARILCGLVSLISQTDFAAILDAKLAAYLQWHLNPYQILNAFH
jgi:hypothetical protein